MTASIAQRAARMLGPRDDEPEDDDDSPGIFALSVRLPSRVAATVWAMSDQAGCSRNEMANLIVEAGIEAIFSVTAEENVMAIKEKADFHIEDFI